MRCRCLRLIEVVYSGFRLDLHVDLVDTVSLHSQHCFYHPRRTTQANFSSTDSHSCYSYYRRFLQSLLIAYPEIVQSTFEAPILQNPAYSSLSSFHSLSLSTALLSLINPILITRLFLNTLETNAHSEADLTLFSFLFFIPLLPFPFPSR